MYSWKERLADWWNRISERWELRREVWVHILMSCGITLIVVAIILGISLGMMKAGIRQQEEQFAQDLVDIINQLEVDYDQFQVGMEEVAEDFRAYLDEQLAQWQGKITTLETETAQLRSAMDDLAYSDAFPYVAGTFGDYTLHMKSMTGGNFTANVHLLQAAGNSTAAWFNVGHFELVPGEELALAVNCTGLNITWVPALVYAEVFRLSS